VSSVRLRKGSREITGRMMSLTRAFAQAVKEAARLSCENAGAETLVGCTQREEEAWLLCEEQKLFTLDQRLPRAHCRVGQSC